ncbi:MAG TPA: hypothetical protein VF458_14075 [Ktedonobacteraceae bacterium]
MSALQRASRFWLGEPLAWIFYAFARPQRLEEALSAQDPTFEPEQILSPSSSAEKQLVFEAQRLPIPLLRVLPATLLVNAGLALLIQEVLSLIRPVQPLNAPEFLLDAGLALASGLVLGLLFALVFGLREGLISCLLTTLSFGPATGIAVMLPGANVHFSVLAFILILGISSFFVYGLAARPSINELTFQRTSLVMRISGIFCLFIVLFLALVVLASFGILPISGLMLLVVPFPSALALLLSFFGALLLGFFRLPFYLASVPSIILAYRACRKQPQRVFEYLHHSALYWDEHTSLPLPFLKRLLLVAYEVSAEKALTEMAFIIAQRPWQVGVARAALLEIALRDLETRINLEQVADARRLLDTLFSAENQLADPRLARVLASLNDVSRDATRALSPIGLPGKRKALEEMQANLLKVNARAAFRDQRLNARLLRIVSIWRVVAQQELTRLAGAAQEIGSLDNPYKPGQVLSPRDSLFVGRHHLAQELEGALSMSGRWPAFLLNSERRMGKTSALQQLPYLLGSSYISVFYNLQQPSLYAGTATFLGFLAEGITREIKARALKVNPLVYSALRLQPGDAHVYRAFETWLDHVEELLTREDRMLLLTFDEFEALEEIEKARYMDVHQLLNWMRSIIQFRPRVVLLFSGVKTFTEMGEQGVLDWVGYFINVQMLRISFLKPDEARHLILHPTAEYPGPEIFPPTVVDAIIHETGCHPFLLQAVCSTLITLLNVQKQETATLDDVRHATDRVLEEWISHFAHLWQRTNLEQRACLKILLTHAQAGEEQIATLAWLDEKIARRSLLQLLRRDLVLRNPDSTYSIAVPMFQNWLERNT